MVHGLRSYSPLDTCRCHSWILLPEWAYLSFNGHLPATQEVLDLFKGDWGQTLLFGLGYVFTAIDPQRHGLVALLGGTGKVLFALRLLGSTDSEALSSFSLLALIGDMIFAGLIVTYVISTGQWRTYLRRQS